MELSVTEGRVLGCLIEKQLTEPDSTYSLTLDELRFSCNQTTGRDPVVAFDDRTVEDTLLSLKAMGLARFVSIDHRIGPMTYRHRADERWRLARPELTVLSILLLRGPQTVEQIWSLVEGQAVDGQAVAESPTEIEVALDTLAGRTPMPLTARLARSGGPDGVSWVEVLTGRYTLDPPPAEPYEPDPRVPSRRGSGLPAREPWRPDERFDSRGRRDPRGEPRSDPRSDPRGGPEPDQRQDRRGPGDGRNQQDPRGPRDQRDQRERRDEPARDRREPGDTRGPRDPREQRDERRERREPPRPVRAGPPVPVAVPADQAGRPAPTLTELADRLTNIERRLAGIEAALAALRPAGGQPPASPAQTPPPPQAPHQSQGQPQPQRPPGPPSRPQPSGPPPAPSRSHR